MFSPARLALVSGGLKLGGSTTFLCNLGGELVRRGFEVQVLSFEKENPLKADFRRLNVPTVCYDDGEFILEDRIQAMLLHLSEFGPSVILANLSPTSFEILRYVPRGVFRIGVAH